VLERLEKELLVEGLAQGIGARTLEPTQPTTQQTSSIPPQATVEVRRPEDPPQQPPRQVEVLATDTSALATQHPSQLQNSEAQEEQ
jgi:hypothetical protein